MGPTDTAIRRSHPTEKPYKLADGNGLYLLVNPSGSKLWRWKYRFDGKEKLMPFGEILEMLRTITGSGPLLFPGEREPNKPMSNNTILFALRRMGYGGRMTGHGFRGLASTLLHEQGYQHEHIELQLAHAPRNAVSAAYNHALYLEPRAKMMQDWANYLEQAQRGGNVLAFREVAV